MASEFLICRTMAAADHSKRWHKLKGHLQSPLWNCEFSSTPAKHNTVSPTNRKRIYQNFIIYVRYCLPLSLNNEISYLWMKYWSHVLSILFWCIFVYRWINMNILHWSSRDSQKRKKTHEDESEDIYVYVEASRESRHQTVHPNVAQYRRWPIEESTVYANLSNDVCHVHSDNLEGYPSEQLPSNKISSSNTQFDLINGNKISFPIDTATPFTKFPYMSEGAMDEIIQPADGCIALV